MSTHSSAPGRPVSPDGDRLPGGVPAGVRQALLHHPVRGAPDRVRRRVARSQSVQAHLLPASRASSTRRGTSANTGARARLVGRRSRSTPITSRRSSSAWCTPARTTPAALATCSAGASGRYSSAPAYVATRVSRCASTSCISRAMRVRSRARASATRRSRSSSARWARSRSEPSSAHRAWLSAPQPTRAA